MHIRVHQKRSTCPLGLLILKQSIKKLVWQDNLVRLQKWWGNTKWLVWFSPWRLSWTKEYTKIRYVCSVTELRVI